MIRHDLRELATGLLHVGGCLIWIGIVVGLFALGQWALHVVAG